MRRPQMRPSFVVEVEGSSDSVLEALQHELEANKSRYTGKVFPGHAVVSHHPSGRTFWSPHLFIDIEDQADGKAVLRGRFSPHPTVWSVFLSIYGVLIIASFAAIVYGMVQVSLTQPPWAFVGVPVAIALAGFVYGATLIGQGLGAEQMYEIRALVDRAVQS